MPMVVYPAVQSSHASKVDTYTREDCWCCCWGGGASGGGAGGGMERIVGLLKWVGEMGCPQPSYNHAIL